MVDYHIHTYFCNHAEGNPEDYCTQGIKLGLREMGFSDHFPANYQPRYSFDIKGITMRESDIEKYLDLVEQLKLKFKKIRIKKAFEVDFLPQENLFFNKYLDLYDELDYIICSVHFVDEFAVDQFEQYTVVKKYGIEKFWCDYFEKMKICLQNFSGKFDIIGHIDLPKKFLGEMPSIVQEKFLEVINLINEYEKVVEINTSGWDRPIKEQYPSKFILELLHKYNIEVTLGSDAHAPLEVGRYFFNAIQLLKEIGYDRIISFNKHKKDYYKL